MTSNLGSDQIHEMFEGKKEKDYPAIIENAHGMINELLRKTIRPEFLNRIDEVLLFTPLTQENIHEIVDIQLEDLKETLKEKGFSLVVTHDAIEWIAKTGFDPFFGARPVKRLIQKQVLTELSKAILSNSIDKEHNVVLDVFDGKVVFRKPVNEIEELRVE